MNPVEKWARQWVSYGNKFDNVFHIKKKKKKDKWTRYEQTIRKKYIGTN